MKKIIITIAFAVLATASAFAQSLSAGAGYTSYKFSTKLGDNDAKKGDAINGFYAGADATVLNLGPVAVTPGIYFAYASATTTASALGFSQSGTTKEMYLDIPVNFSYGIDLGPARVFAYAGPTISLGCSSTYEFDGVIKTDPTDLYGDDSKYGRFDIMLGGGLGVDIACIRISAGYNFGMLDRNSSDSIKYTRSGLHAGISYLF